MTPYFIQEVTYARWDWPYIKKNKTGLHSFDFLMKSWERYGVSSFGYTYFHGINVKKIPIFELLIIGVHLELFGGGSQVWKCLLSSAVKNNALTQLIQLQV